MQEKTSEEEEMITDESTVDLQQFVPVGGVYRIDGLQLPPQVQQINSWWVVELPSTGALLPAALVCLLCPSAELVKASLCSQGCSGCLSE